MAQELLNVKTQIKSGVQIVGRELTQIDDPVRILDLEAQKGQASFAAELEVAGGWKRQTIDRPETRQSHPSSRRQYKGPRRRMCTGTYCWIKRSFC